MTPKVWADIRHILIGTLLKLILWMVPKDACGDIILAHIHAMSKDIIKIMELEDERNNRTRPNPRH